MKKNHARQLTLKIFMQWPKILAGRKFPSPPPITFLMVRPLKWLSSHQDIVAGLGQFCAEVIT